jgi:hypothetical protein
MHTITILENIEDVMRIADAGKPIAANEVRLTPELHGKVCVNLRMNTVHIEGGNCQTQNAGSVQADEFIRYLMDKCGFQDVEVLSYRKDEN